MFIHFIMILYPVLGIGLGNEVREMHEMLYYKYIIIITNNYCLLSAPPSACSVLGAL